MGDFAIVVYGHRVQVVEVDRVFFVLHTACFGLFKSDRSTPVMYHGLLMIVVFIAFSVNLPITMTKKGGLIE